MTESERAAMDIHRGVQNEYVTCVAKQTRIQQAIDAATAEYVRICPKCGVMPNSMGIHYQAMLKEKDAEIERLKAQAKESYEASLVYRKLAEDRIAALERVVERVVEAVRAYNHYPSRQVLVIADKRHD